MINSAACKPMAVSFQCMTKFTTNKKYLKKYIFNSLSLSSVQSVLSSCSVMSDSLWPMDSNSPGFTVHHQLLDPTQTHIHCIGNAIQPSHPLSSPSPPGLASIFPSIRVFSSESVLHSRWPKFWSFSFSICPSSEYSGLTSFRIDWLNWGSC